jgi:hypothetical protein
VPQASAIAQFLDETLSSRSRKWQEATIDLSLQVKGASQTVEVRAQSAILQTRNANLATRFNTAQMVDIPMVGGDITIIAVPGVPVGGAVGETSASTAYRDTAAKRQFTQEL